MHSTTTALWETAEGRHSRGGEEATARLGEAEPLSTQRVDECDGAGELQN